MIAVLLSAMLFAASPEPAGARGLTSACPHENGHVIEESQVEFPANAHPTNPRVRFLLDLGSDGRVRRSALVESSGDAAVDAAAAKALADFRFSVPTSGCVSTSSALSRWWNIPPHELAPPAPGDAAASSPPVACVAPFIRPMRFPLPHRREVPGTASVDVGLDANARVTAVRLVQSSGNKKTDYAATVAARNGLYAFEHQAGCARTVTTYRLELTFR